MSTNRTKILIIDDDVNICKLVSLYMEKEGYTARSIHNGTEAVETFKDFSPNIVILDIMLPGIDGLQICNELKRISNIPIIMLTAKGETFDKVLGLELGADDYIVKPFESKELVARVRAVLRRYEHKVVDNMIVEHGNLKIDKSNHVILVEGKQVDLPPKEFELLYFLASNPNKVFTREQLLEYVWQFDFYGDSRTIDVHIKRLREKTETEGQKWGIRTVWGVGYKFEVK